MLQYLFQKYYFSYKKEMQKYQLQLETILANALPKTVKCLYTKSVRLSKY